MERRVRSGSATLLEADFDDDRAVEVGVAGFVGDAHAAFAEFAGDLVMEEALTLA